MKSLRTTSSAAVLFKLVFITLSLLPYGAFTSEETAADQRTLQKESINTCSNTPTSNKYPSSSKAVIDRVLTYLDDNKASIQSMLFQSYTSQYRNKTKDSTAYLYSDFRSNLEWMARDGIPNPNTNGKPIKFYLGPDNCNNDGWQIGLINIAAFLSQAMTLGIHNDTCDELNWEMVDEGVYPLSNACGMRGWDYQRNFHSCEFDCPVKKNMMVKAVDKSKLSRTPPPLECYPRTENRKFTGYFDPKKGVLDDVIVDSFLGRTDVEGCCFWGRGALQTKGTCNFGKLNHYLGKGAADDGRESRYKDIDFCNDPEAICSDKRTMELRWVVALFEWAERIQSYDSDGWNYIDQLHKVVEGDLLNDLKFERSNFIDEVGGILEQGCHNPPCDAVERLQRLNWGNARKSNFRVALEAFGLPLKSSAFREIESILMNGKGAFEEVVLRSINPKDKTTYQSYRYQFADFMEALQLMADIGYDNKSFYIGQKPNGESDVITGLINIALFLSQAYVQSIQDDACDEHNTQTIHGRYPVSNACGQYGLSYQDLNCTGVDAEKTCPLDPDQSFSAVTRSLALRAPQPFKCAPKTQFPVTGYWDERRVEENHRTAYANQNGRIDVENCCWWGRGVFRNVTRGRCFFGQMNYYLGKRAASEGRASLYPTVDFCLFPESICASEHSHQLRWVSGMFHWIQEVQSYDQRGWSYMDQIRDLSLNETLGGELNATLSMQVDCILKTGKAICNETSIETDLADQILSALIAFNLPTTSPTVTRPTPKPQPLPTTSPVIPPSPYPTVSMQPTSSPVIFDVPSKATIEYVINYLEDKESAIRSNILMPLNGEEGIYTYEAFIETLGLMARGIKREKYFYVGGDAQTRQRGLVNIAAFLAHVRTLSIETNTCDEPNTDFTNQTQYPLSNACGQYGQSYQDMRCHKDEAFMECKPDPAMQMTGVLSENAGANPPPFFCGPKQYFPFTGFYDSIDNTVKSDAPLGNAIGRTDVEQCCWWGRGSARVAGVCLYGKLNYYFKDLFPGIDFCENPSSICSSAFSFSLMWITGMFVWVEYAQSYALYSDALDRFVDGEITDQELIDIISDSLDSGMNKEHRLTNFQLALNTLEVELSPKPGVISV